MTEINGGVRWKKVMSIKNQGLQHRRKEEEVDTLLLGNDKNNVVVNYLLSFYLKGYLKSGIDELPRKKNKYQLQDISL